MLLAFCFLVASDAASELAWRFCWAVDLRAALLSMTGGSAAPGRFKLRSIKGVVESPLRASWPSPCDWS